MMLDLRAEPVPLRVDTGGVVRVGQTRVTLHTVVTAFHQGLGAEEIADRYPSLTLPDVYSVLGYYLRHRSVLDAYLEEQRLAAEEFRAENQQRWPSQALRKKLLARLRRPEQ
jgi:uncharacterized protein (DUF433 family)